MNLSRKLMLISKINKQNSCSHFSMKFEWLSFGLLRVVTTRILLHDMKHGTSMKNWFCTRTRWITKFQSIISRSPDLLTFHFFFWIFNLIWLDMRLWCVIPIHQCCYSSVFRFQRTKKKHNYNPYQWDPSEWDRTRKHFVPFSHRSIYIYIFVSNFQRMTVIHKAKNRQNEIFFFRVSWESVC